MESNKEAYNAAYQRAVDGKAPTLLSRIFGAFDDEYTRRSRMKGEKDGAAARAAAPPSGEAAAG